MPHPILQVAMGVLVPTVLAALFMAAIFYFAVVRKSGLMKGLKKNDAVLVFQVVPVPPPPAQNPVTRATTSFQCGEGEVPAVS